MLICFKYFCNMFASIEKNNPNFRNPISIFLFKNVVIMYKQFFLKRQKTTFFWHFFQKVILNLSSKSNFLSYHVEHHIPLIWTLQYRYLFLLIPVWSSVLMESYSPVLDEHFLRNIPRHERENKLPNNTLVEVARH
jgi:hypothetical protein